MGNPLFAALGSLAFEKAPTPARTGRQGEQAQFTGCIGAIRERSRITGQVIPTRALSGQGFRKTAPPDPSGLLLGQAHGLGPNQEIVEGTAKARQNPAAKSLVEAGVHMFLVQAAAEKVMPAAKTRQACHHGRHDGFSMRPGLS